MTTLMRRPPARINGDITVTIEYGGEYRMACCRNRLCNCNISWLASIWNVHSEVIVS